MSARANQAVHAAIDLAIKEYGEVGLQVAAYVDGKQVVDAWGGIADQQTGRKVDGDTLFCPMSVTKAVTAVALHIQADRGLVEYAAPVAKYWPEFGVFGKEKGTVYDVLTHRVGLPFMPAGVTPELMCDWEWMTTQIARMHPLFEPGTRSAYQSLTFGWLIGEVVRRTDPQERPFGQFVQDEICKPLGIDSLWLGAPDHAIPRVARLIAPPNLGVKDPGYRPDDWRALSHPAAVQSPEAVYGQRQVMQACLPGSGALMNARSCARFYSMLAELGALDGVRLLSEARVRTFHVLRPPVDWDLTLGKPHAGTVGGFWQSGTPNMAVVGTSPRAYGHPGFGGSVGWNDPDHRFSMAILHNRLFGGESAGSVRDGRSFVMIAEAARKELGIRG